MAERPLVQSVRGKHREESTGRNGSYLLLWMGGPVTDGYQALRSTGPDASRVVFSPALRQNSRRKANCISRGVPEPTGVMGETMAVFRLTVLMMLPKPVGLDGLKVDCGWPS